MFEAQSDRMMLAKNPGSTRIVRIYRKEHEASPKGSRPREKIPEKEALILIVPFLTILLP